MAEFLSIIVKVAAVALIVFVTRGLISTEGAKLPRMQGNAAVYSVKWQMRALGFGGALIFLAFVDWSRHDWMRRSDWWIVTIPVAFVFLGLWLANGGSVITNEIGITKRVLGRSRSLRWDEITAIRFYQRQRYLELRAGPQKLSIDTRFIAVRHLLDEVVNRTKLQPTMK